MGVNFKYEMYVSWKFTGNVKIYTLLSEKPKRPDFNNLILTNVQKICIKHQFNKEYSIDLYIIILE